MPSEVPEGARVELEMFLGSKRHLLDESKKVAALAQVLVSFRYGADKARLESPFVAADLGDIWQVRSTNPGETVPFSKTYTVLYLDKRSANLLGWLHESEQEAPSLPKPDADHHPP